MDDAQWGVGNKADSLPFDTAMVGDERVELINGEHPHSRSYNNHYARWPNGRVEGFDGHRVQTKVEIETYNYLKTSGLSGDEVRKGGTGRIYFNGRQVYEFFFRDPERALIQAHNLLGKLLEHNSRLFESDAIRKLEGKKVFYRNTPAIIERVILDQGSVILKADTPEGLFPLAPWEKENAEQREREPTIKDDILSDDIWWWRDS